MKQAIGFAPERSLPPLPPVTLRRWHARHLRRRRAATPAPLGRVYFFCDEFTNHHDAAIGIKAVQLLERLGYDVALPAHAASGRAQLSKGFVRAAQRLATRNVARLSPLISDETPLIGLEPSALLGFRDEYPDLVPDGLIPRAHALSRQALLFEEFIAREMERGRISADAFTRESRMIKLHGHCHQKALSSLAPAIRALSLPRNYKVEVIPSGCCGMAGSFGYEAEHFELSQKIGELVLFPAVRASDPATLIAAAGTSCRHQIKDSTGRRALHPAEILFDALV